MSWVAYSDSRRPELPRAVYLAADSRITWGSTERRWEAGRKVFAPSIEPHLFGYCGDVVLPALFLGQIVSAIDTGILFGTTASADDRHQLVTKTLQRAVASAIATPTQDFTIHHLLRERGWPETSFRAWTVTFSAESGTLASTETAIPPKTEMINSFGSGKDAMKAYRQRWQASEASGRSRAIHAAFCESIKSGQDPLSGGAPQLAALYTEGPPVQIGMMVDGHRFMNGLEVERTTSLKHAEWRDALGQNVDPWTGRAKQGARRFARPRKLADD